jgi:hypothetical protein
VGWRAAVPVRRSRRASRDPVGSSTGEFLLSLAFNLSWYESLRRDMLARLAAVRVGSREGTEGKGWKRITLFLNVGAGLALLFGGLALARFVSTSS